MEGWEGSDCAVGGQAQTFELTLFSEVLSGLQVLFCPCSYFIFCCIIDCNKHIEDTHMHIIKG